MYSHFNQTISGLDPNMLFNIMMGVENPLFPCCDDRRRTKKGCPRGDLVTENEKPPCPAVPQRGPEAEENHKNDFYGSGVNSRSFLFLIELKNGHEHPASKKQTDL